MVDLQDSARKRKRSERDDGRCDGHAATVIVRAAHLLPHERINLQRASDQTLPETPLTELPQATAANGSVATIARATSQWGESVPVHGMFCPLGLYLTLARAHPGNPP